MSPVLHVLDSACAELIFGAQAKIAELEASLERVLAEQASMERQRSAGKPPRPPNSGTSSPRGAPSSPFGRNSSGQDAAAGLQIASLEVQVCTGTLSHCIPALCSDVSRVAS